MKNVNVNRIRIMHILPSLEIGGMEKALINLINGLDASVFENVIFCFDSQHSAPTLEHCIKHRETPIYKYEKGDGVHYWLPVRISRILKKQKIDILHARNFAAFLYGTAGAHLSGTHAVVADIRGRIPANQGQKIRRLSFLVSRFVAVSKDVKRLLTDEYQIDQHKVQTIYNGIEGHKQISTNTKMMLRHELGLADDDFVIGSIGRFDPVKNYAGLLRACVPLMKKNPKVKLLLVGDGDEWEHLTQLKKTLQIEEQTIFTGYRKQIFDLLGVMDLFALTSISEGLSNVLLEAMSASLPVVATAVGGNPEIIEDGQTGFLVPSRDSAALTEKIDILLNNRAKLMQFGIAGYRLVTQQFSMKRMIAEYQQLYIELLR